MRLACSNRPVCSPAFRRLAREDRLKAGLRTQCGFTMVEIAICLGVIGFALVAIIGVLPHGMNQQRDNRYDTYVAQDAAYWMEAIRSGAQGLDDLTNYVDKITIDAPGAKREYLYGAPSSSTFSNGRDIIGLLSTPAPAPAAGYTNQAIVRAISGAAVEKSPLNHDVAFRYSLRVDNLPVETMDPTLPELLVLTNYLRELRLAFRWPVLADGSPSGRPPKVFRTQVSGIVTNEPANSVFYYFKQQ
jgi:type II secretory pathway pseudopilin PulG